MRQIGFYLGVIIGALLIIFGGVVILQALPAALNVLEMPSQLPFVQDIYTWLTSSASGLTASLEGSFLQAFQTVLKLILVITFLWVCTRLVAMGVMIIKAGVELVRSAIEHNDAPRERPAAPAKASKAEGPTRVRLRDLD
ncbi:MAG: hypothetical protein ACRCYV_08895 [Aeromonas sp.]